MNNQRLATVGGAAATPGSEDHLVELGPGQRDSTIEQETQPHRGWRQRNKRHLVSLLLPPTSLGARSPISSSSESQQRGAWAVQLQGSAPWDREQVGEGETGLRASRPVTSLEWEIRLSPKQRALR